MAPKGMASGARGTAPRTAPPRASRRRRLLAAGAMAALGSVLWSGAAAGQGPTGRRGAPPPPTDSAVVDAHGTTIVIETPLAAPDWALAERRLLRMDGDGVRLYAKTVLDERGFFPITPAWGVGNGPDDLMENIRNWPLAHALGGDDSIIETWSKAWEGYLQQFTEARIPEVEAARNGIFQREFMTSFDWEHNGEGLGPFYYYGLSRPDDPNYLERLRRFSGFYMNEDARAKNYDPEHRIIRSLFNGSSGPKLTPATADDWDGPVGPEVDPSSSRRTRFRKATNIRGDHPLNLNVTMLPFHAYMLTHEKKYRDWILEYVNAWKDRIAANGGNIPSNIGLDGTIGGEWGGKWYDGVFGWNSPDEGVRNYTLRGPPEAFGIALLLTGDQAYTGVLRRQLDNLFAAKRVVNGKVELPRYYGDDGWYGYAPIAGPPSGALGNQVNVLLDIYMWGGLRPADRARLPAPEDVPRTGAMRFHPDLRWVDFLDGKDPGYPLVALQDGMDEVRQAARRLRSSGYLGANPVSTTALINLTMGAADPGGSTHGPLPLHAQFRYFDPEQRRAGLPPDVGALVERIGPDSVTLVLVNLNPFESRTVTVQMGAYAENQATRVRFGNHVVPVDASHFDVRLAPGAGREMTVGVKRFANQPTLRFPWER